MNSRRRGTTLLELLIAISLVSVLSLGVLYGMRVGIDAMDRTNQRFLKNRRVLGVEKALAAQLTGIMPATVECVNESGAVAGKSILFQGEPTTMRFVSSYSLQEGARGYNKLLEYAVIPGLNGEGVRIIVNEMPFATPLSARGVCVGTMGDPETGRTGPAFLPVLPRPDSFVLADRLAAARFIYREVMPPPVFERWRPRWINSQWPTAVRVELIPLDNNPANLNVMSATIPIRITVNPLAAYVD